MSHSAGVFRKVGASTRREASRKRAAFTLLEVFVALGLTLLLIAAVYASLEMYWKFSSLGRARVERAQLSRALLRQIRLDTQSIVFRTPEVELASTDGAAADEGSTVTYATDTETETGDSGTTGDTTTPAATSAAMSSGLIGTADRLTLHITRPSRQLSYEPMFSGTGPASDQVAVTYFLATPSELTEPLTGTQSLGGIAGLAVQQGDRLAMDYGGTTTVTAATRLLAPEIGSLQFRYFDGQAWYNEWDSVSYGQLPKAVEVSLGFLDDAENGPAASSGWAALSTAPAAPLQVARAVIAIPITPVAVTESSAGALTEDETMSDGTSGDGTDDGTGQSGARAFGDGTGFGEEGNGRPQGGGPNQGGGPDQGGGRPPSGRPPSGRPPSGGGNNPPPGGLPPGFQLPPGISLPPSGGGGGPRGGGGGGRR